MKTKSLSYHLRETLPVVVIALTISVLLGWQFNIEILKRILPGLVAMNPLTAVCFLLSAVSYYYLQDKSRSFFQQSILVSSVGIIFLSGASRIAAYITGFDLKFDQILFTSSLSGSMEVYPNRMAPNTALAFICLSTSFAFHLLRDRRGRNAGQFFAFLTFLVAIFALVGYSYGITSFYGIAAFIPMAVHTASCFVIMSVCMMLLPHSGWLIYAASRFFWKLCAGYFCIIVLTTLVIGFLIGSRLEAHEELRATIVFGAVIATLVALLVGMFFARKVTQPLSLLTDAAVSIANDDYSNPELPASYDEFGRLATAIDQMAGKLRARISDLKTARQAADDANAVKSAFIANVSHEIRTPINGTLGVLKLLGRTPLTHHQKRYLDMALRSAENLNCLIGDILDYSKLEAGKVELESIEFNILEVIEEAVEVVAHRAFEKELFIASYFCSDVPAIVRGDPGRVRQVLLNFMNNAVKFTEKGSVVTRVSVETETQDAVTLMISIVDTGIGIASSKVDKLFKSFSQADSSTSRSYGGTGLGLAISKEMTELMGGEVGLQSEEGKGSVFWVKLPFDKIQNPDVQQKITKNPLVLVVEKGLSQSGILREQLESWGFTVALAHSRSEVKELLNKNSNTTNQYMAALIDSEVPEYFEIPSDMKNFYKESCPVSVLLAPLTVDIETLKAEKWGFKGTISKPIRQSLLLDNILLATGQATHSRIFSKSKASESIPDIGAGYKVLLAEDNEINRVVAEDTLQEMGFKVDKVCNGDEAVEHASSNEYDLIIMDCQMPIMDGYQATFLIRKNEANTGKRVPIIALTANALSGEREFCLASGMDGYCAKPLNVEKLAAIIAPFLKVSLEPAPEDVKTESQKSTAPIDIVELQTRCMGKTMIVNKVLESLKDEVRNGVTQLIELHKAQDFHKLSRVAHGMRGAASTAAAGKFFEIASQIEAAAKGRDLNKIHALIQELSTEGEVIRDYISEKLSNP